MSSTTLFGYGGKKAHTEQHICTSQGEKQNSSCSLFLSWPEPFQFIISVDLIK